MKSETMYRLLVVTVFVLFMVVGIYIGVEMSDKDVEIEDQAIVSNNDAIKIYDEEVVNIVEETVTEVSVKYTDIYPDCGHSIDSEEYYETTTKTEVKKDIEAKDLGYRLVGEQYGILLYQKVHTGKCMNHYKVCLENDVVVIYRMSLNNEFKLYQVTEITSSMLREGIKEQLEQGIVVDDVEELFLLMEDIES